MVPYLRFFLPLSMAVISLTPVLCEAQTPSVTPASSTRPSATKNTIYVLDKIWKADGTDVLSLNDPEAINAGPDGTLYIADTGNNRVVVWNPDTNAIKIYGSFGSKADWRNPPQFQQPCGILFYTTTNQIYVGDTGNNRVVVLDQDGMAVTTWGTQGTDNSQFNQPRTIARDHFGNVWVLDSGNSRVQIFSPMGEFKSVWGSFGTGDYLLNNPLGMAIDHIDQAIIADTGNFRFEVFNNGAVPVTQEGWWDEGPFQFKSPAGAVDTPMGKIAIVDINCVDFYDGRDGEYEYLGRWKAGSHWAKSAPKFHGITSDRQSRIYLTDVANNWIVRLRPLGPHDAVLPLNPTPTPENVSPYGGNGYPIR